MEQLVPARYLEEVRFLSVERRTMLELCRFVTRLNVRSVEEGFDQLVYCKDVKVDIIACHL